MGLDLFLDNDVDDVKIPDKDYKSKVDASIKTKFDDEPKEDTTAAKKKRATNKINLPNRKGTIKDRRLKKVAMSIYFRDEDIKLIKALSWEYGLTVNDTMMHIIEPFLTKSRANLEDDFNIEELAALYDANSKRKKKKVEEETE